MAEELLVSEIPGGRRYPLVKQGAKLLRLLDEGGIPITAAFWLFDREDETWKYVLATPRFSIEGPLKIYKTLQEYVGNTGLTLQDIAVVSPHEPLVDLLRKSLGTAPKSISAIRITANTISNVFIDDAYVYRAA